MAEPRAITDPSDATASAGRRTYVVDTSVLLADAMALERFEEHDVVLPLVVISELEAKRHHTELGHMARSALRYLETLRNRHGSLTEPIAMPNGGTVRIELNHVDDSRLPAPMRSEANDARILAVADNLAREGAEVVVVPTVTVPAYGERTAQSRDLLPHQRGSRRHQGIACRAAKDLSGLRSETRVGDCRRVRRSRPYRR